MTSRPQANENGEIRQVPIKHLLLDEENPRLSSGQGAHSQDDLVKILWSEMAVDEVAFSIAANGYFPEEPLFVIPQSARDKGKYIVVEGNRRLAAVLLLCDDELRRKVGATDLPSITVQARSRLQTLPVSVYRSREALWPFLGFRHINGAKPWDAFSKAHYVADVYERYGVPLKEITRKIGDRHSYVLRIYRGLKLLQQAESTGLFSREDAVGNRFYFSHLYTAADQPEFQRFVGITSEGSLRKNPVPKTKLKELNELVTWLYGNRKTGIEPVIRSQNPDLNRLRAVIASPSGISALRSGYSLDRSHEISVGDERRFREALNRAKEELVQAKGTVTTGYQGEPDLLDTMQDVLLVANTIQQEMNTKASTSRRSRQR